jgi:hypothetical protein
MTFRIMAGSLVFAKAVAQIIAAEKLAVEHGAVSPAAEAPISVGAWEGTYGMPFLEVDTSRLRIQKLLPRVPALRNNSSCFHSGSKMS